MFDAGLCTVSPNGDHFLIKVAKQCVTDSSPQGRSLGIFNGGILQLHPSLGLRPASAKLAWQRSEHRTASHRIA